MGLARGAGVSKTILLVLLFTCEWIPAASTATVTRGLPAKRLLLTGEVVPAESLSIAVPRVRSQFLLTIAYLAPEGARVEPGDVLVRFDTSDLLTRRLDLERQVEEARLRLAQTTAEQEAMLQDLELQMAQAETELAIAELYAAIDPELLPREKYEEHQLRLATARLELEKVRERRDSYGKTAAADLELIRLDLEKAEADLQVVTEEIERLTIRSPIAGLVLHEVNWMRGRKVQPGDSLYSGLPILRLPNVDRPQVKARVYDVDYPLLRLGTPAEIRFDGFPEWVMEGELVDLSPVTQPPYPGSPLRVFDAVFQLRGEPPQPLRPGTTVRVEVEVEEPLGGEESLLVPRRAVRVGADGRTYVRLDGAAPRDVPVTVLNAAADLVAVAGDLREGDTVELASAAGDGDTGIQDPLQAWEWVAVERQDLSVTVPGTGQVRARRSVDISSPVVGNQYRFKIAWLAPEGAQVQAGDRLVVFDGRELQQRLQEDQGQLQKAQQTLERTRASLELQIQDLELQIEEARAAEARARNKLAGAREFESILQAREAQLQLELAEKRTRFLETKLAAVRRRTESQIRILEEQIAFYRRRVEAGRESLAKLEVRAPIAGIVVYAADWRNRKRQVGDEVTPSDTVLSLPDLSSLFVEGFIQEMDLWKVRLGQDARLSFDVLPGEPVSGKLVNLGEVLEAVSPQRPIKNLRVELELAGNLPPVLRPGMSARFELLVEELHDVILLPAAAVQEREGRFYVLVQGRPGIEEREIRVGRTVGESVVVESGLEVGERVAVPRGPSPGELSREGPESRR
ncbi:MAG: hypothetical protein Kow00109_17320 [Acidobacteriota bacterium]